MPHALRRYFDYKPRRVNYLTHISRRHHAVFVEVPKAGCTVVKRVLQMAEDPAAANVESVHDRSTSPLGRVFRSGIDVDELFGPKSDWFRFTFVRNPYSRAQWRSHLYQLVDAQAFDDQGVYGVRRQDIVEDEGAVAFEHGDDLGGRRVGCEVGQGWHGHSS